MAVTAWSRAVHGCGDRILEEIEVPKYLEILGEVRGHLEVRPDQLVLAVDPEGRAAAAGMAERPERREPGADIDEPAAAAAGVGRERAVVQQREDAVLVRVRPCR